jgi:hypothetical protein
LKEFNFPQFLQGENNPHSVFLLQDGLTNQGEKVLKLLGWKHYFFIFLPCCASPQVPFQKLAGVKGEQKLLYLDLMNSFT